MVGRRSSSGSKKPPVVSEPAVPHRSKRPKRNISPKSYDITAGLSWKEERELKKALYASLQESKKASTSKPDTATDWKTPSDAGFRPIKTKPSTTRMTRSFSSPNVPSTPVTSGQSVNSVDETSQDSTVSLPINTSTLQSKKTKVRAQRKFAMNQPNTITPSSETSSTPVPKATTSSTIVFPKRAKTEDFLTFLCLRGTSLLPPHLDFFNYSRYDNSSLSGRNGRDSSSSSSSTSISNGTEEPMFTPVNKFTTPCKKAARASAGTPETCRGLAGVKRLDKTPKTKSPLARRGRPARALNITPVKTPPIKETSPSKIINNRLGKRRLGKDRLASKRKAVATLTQKAPPVKFKKTEPAEEQNKANKVTKALGVACSDIVSCSLHGRMVDCTCLVECQNIFTPAYSTNIDASLTNLCISNFPDLFPLIPPDFYNLSENDHPPELYSDVQEECDLVNKDNAENVQTSDGNMLQTVQSEVTEDIKMLTDDMLDAAKQNSPVEKAIATVIQTRLSDDDVLFATSAIKICKIETEEQQTNSGTSVQPSHQTEEGVEEMLTLKEEQDLSDEEYQSILSSNGLTYLQEIPELVLKEEPDFLDLDHGGLSVFSEPFLQPGNTNDLASSNPESACSNSVQQEGQICTLSQDTTLSNQDQFYPEGDAVNKKESPNTVLNTSQTSAHSFCVEVRRVPDHEVICSGKSCDVTKSTYPGNVTDDSKMEDTGLSYVQNGDNISDIRKITSPSLAGDLFYENQQKLKSSTELMSNSEACIVGANKPQDFEYRHTAAGLEYTKNSENKPVYEQDKDVPLDLSLPKEQKHGSGKNTEICNRDLSLIPLSSERLIHVPSLLNQGITSIKIETDKIIIHHKSKREQTEMSSNEQIVKHLGIGLKVQNRCDERRQVNVVLPYCLVKSDVSSKVVAPLNNSMNVDTEELKSPGRVDCSGDQIVPLDLHTDSNKETFAAEETDSNLPKLHAVNCLSLKRPLMIKTDAIKLGSNVFQRPPHMPGIVWKSNKKPVIDFAKSKGQPFSDVHFPQSISRPLSDTSSMETLSNDTQSHPAPLINHSSYELEEKHCSGSQNHHAPLATHSTRQLSHDSVMTPTSISDRHLLPLTEQSARQISRNSREKLPSITQTNLMPDLLRNLNDCLNMSRKEAEVSETAAVSVLTDDSLQKPMVTSYLSPPLQPTIPQESLSSESETDNVRFKCRKDFLKEFRIHPSEVDENCNTRVSQSQASPWFGQYVQHGLLDSSNNNDVETKDKGKHGESKDTEQHQSNTPSSQLMDSMENCQILNVDSHILQENKRKSCDGSYSSKSIDENRNILIMDRNIHDRNNCSVPNINCQQRKGLYPLPPAIMSSWYFPPKCALQVTRQTSKKRPIGPKINKVMTLPNDYIAMRLPRRQAKQNALKFYMEDLDDVEERSTSDDEVTFPHKRKFKEFMSEAHDFPFKNSRFKKMNKNSLKSTTHGRQLLRNRLKFNKDFSHGERRSTRSSSKSSDSNSTESSDVSKRNVNQDFSGSNIKSNKDKSNNDKHQTNVPERRPVRQQRVTRLSESNTHPNSNSESSPEQPKTRKNSVGSKNLRLRDSESPLKSLRSDTPQSPREISTSLTEIPTFYPTEEEFQRPLQYVQSIAPRAEPYGMCKIIPPVSWKMEGKISEDIRFTSQKQYTHKLFKRFGPNVEKLECIRKHLEALNPAEQIQIPEIGGVELDVCDLDRTIQDFGGMRHEVEKKKWARVADAMNVPKMAQDRGTKLYDAYCKFLLSYNDLTAEEKSKLEGQVKAERMKVKREDQEEDCIVKGKNMSLGRFIQMARNTASQHLKEQTLKTEELEKQFWEIVGSRTRHIAVHGGHVDTKTQNCSLFPTKKENHYSKHPWNLNLLPQHSQSLLRYLGPVPGVTVPTLHVGMLYTASCWSTDIHHLPYVQYLHGEGDIVWYAVPAQEEAKFKSVMKEVIPTLVSNSPRWLKEDTAMVPPEILLQKGVHLSRCVQSPHQFVVVFPKCYTATISCGYTLAESAHFATKEWIQLGFQTAETLQTCQEPELFSMDELVCQIMEDTTTPPDLLRLGIPAFEQIL
ncbi:uncharacterized protein LOC133204955 [Saccostrea echinata]|uniref:uncharacterized protein LOC133204955 n=1 Tax=Saccostrea echinata TaxID=191078 RepID=UPI002A7F665D|nr:uncharacterized protein LOC133204955 [Saccostrea echinata]